jgi:glycosyltransferase involved in cell wall biosynthesis
LKTIDCHFFKNVFLRNSKTLKKKIVIAVISDLVTDQRIHKTAKTLYEHNYDVRVVGAKRRKSKALTKQSYQTGRIAMLFQRGPLFYAEWNIRLFFKLLFVKTDLIHANDLDTLPACFLVSRLRRKKLVYDSHEYFTELEEIQHRSFVKKTWTKLERWLFKKPQQVYTVNESIAAIYREKYKRVVGVVRNLPLKSDDHLVETTPVSLPFKAEKKILLSQGAGLHHNRGLEELILSLKYLPEEFVLVFAGSGLAVDDLKQLSANEQLEDRVHFTGLLPFYDLRALTQKAWLGLSLDKPSSLNHLYSLPNKLFDYIHAGVPVVVGRLPEVAAIIEQYRCGWVIDEVKPELIAKAVLKADNDKEEYHLRKQNCLPAAGELNWENEEPVLLDIIEKALLS